MFEIQNYSSFIAAFILFQLFPGAGTITILNASARGGIGCGMKAVFGTLSVDFTYMLAAVLGLATLLSAYPGLLEGVQWVGVAYLCWTGLKLLRSSVTGQPTGLVADKEGWAYYRHASLLASRTHKSSCIFLTFFPLLLSTQSTNVTLFALMTHVTAIGFVIQSSLVLSGKAIALYLSQWKYARLMFSRLDGVVFSGFGVKLALNNL